MTRMLRVVWAAVLALTVLAGCQVDADVTVRMAEDGSGTVTAAVILDPEAAARIPDLAEQLQVADMEASGWTVEGPETVEGGGVRISARKPFANPAEGEAVLGELTGPEGLLREITLARDRSFGRTAYAFSAVADPSGGVAALTDDDLVAILGGDGFGGQLQLIQEETGAAADDQVSLTLEVAVPGSTGTWTLEPGGEPVDLALEHEEYRPLPWALVAVAVLAGVGGLVLFVVRLLRGGRSRSGDHAPDAGRAGDEGSYPAGPGPEPATAHPTSGELTVEGVSADDIPWAGEGTAIGDAEEDRGTAPSTRRLELVVLDVDGVVLTTGDDTPALLAAFVAGRGGGVDPSVVAETWARAAEGRITVGELWASLGLQDDPGHLSDEFLALHRTRPGLRDFLERMVARGLPVAAVADDVAEWSRRLRATHRLDHLTRAWIVSGDVGERLPGGAVLGRVLQVTGVDARSALFISHRLDHLDAARSFGFAGVWFAPEDAEVGDQPPYPVIRSFADIGMR